MLACLHSCWLSAPGEGFCPVLNTVNSSYICHAWETAVCSVGGWGASSGWSPPLKPQATESSSPLEKGPGDSEAAA